MYSTCFLANTTCSYFTCIFIYTILNVLSYATHSSTFTPLVQEAPEKTAEEELWFKWSELLRNVEDSLKKKAQVIKQLARQGIPDQLRGMAWQLLSGSQDNALKEQYPALITVSVCGGG